MRKFKVYSLGLDRTVIAIGEFLGERAAEMVVKRLRSEATLETTGAYIWYQEAEAPEPKGVIS